MKRSTINNIMREARDFLADHKFHLPPFAFWSPRDWAGKGSDCREIVEQQLGWDITDFGSDNFEKTGLFLFTIRNGTLAGLKDPLGKTYAEKIMIVREDQLTPTHFHHQKMEDIINRGGGNLLIRMWNATEDDRLEGAPVTVSMDGVRVTIPAGETIRLRPGESVCLPQRNYHRFWGEAGQGAVLVGEVSRVNDDRTDNHFFEPTGRFPAIEEDEEPLHLLYGDYQRYCAHLSA
ncbi:MAG: D-lyxose/D-mannose family sugar isomerase [Kiritimatiellia bacterium]|nr:D-lyxose/D-mannose family sugar isomerase [Lentisphaerota bacterium]